MATSSVKVVTRSGKAAIPGPILTRNAKNVINIFIPTDKLHSSNLTKMRNAGLILKKNIPHIYVASVKLLVITAVQELSLVNMEVIDG
jgi:hypothetical protein